mmetsp:Transcript_9029/g.22036  ORF Transcript_9029/g.22036 Transcript_9029/m.22036 type:complete len:221 (+) Transcript_9029:8217-8879(+)
MRGTSTTVPFGVRISSSCCEFSSLGVSASAVMRIGPRSPLGSLRSAADGGSAAIGDAPRSGRGDVLASPPVVPAAPSPSGPPPAAFSFDAGGPPSSPPVLPDPVTAPSVAAGCASAAAPLPLSTPAKPLLSPAAALASGPATAACSSGAAPLNWRLVDLEPLGGLVPTTTSPTTAVAANTFSPPGEAGTCCTVPAAEVDDLGYTVALSSSLACVVELAGS